jgi:hypothetical protein
MHVVCIMYGMIVSLHREPKDNNARTGNNLEIIRDMNRQPLSTSIPTSADRQIRMSLKQQPKALTKKGSNNTVQLAVPLTKGQTQFSKNPRHNVGARKIEFTTLCCFATIALDDVHERCTKAAVRLNRHGRKGIAGIFPAPILDKRGGVALCCRRTRALCSRPSIG